MGIEKLKLNKEAKPKVKKEAKPKVKAKAFHDGGSSYDRPDPDGRKLYRS